jgi:hypothetical protein
MKFTQRRYKLQTLKILNQDINFKKLKNIKSRYKLQTIKISNQDDLGPIFRTFFYAENSVEFLGNMIFQNLFRGKFHFFSTFFGGKFSAEFSPKFSLEKMYERSAPGIASACHRGDWSYGS